LTETWRDQQSLWSTWTVLCTPRQPACEHDWSWREKQHPQSPAGRVPPAQTLTEKSVQKSLPGQRSLAKSRRLLNQKKRGLRDNTSAFLVCLKGWLADKGLLWVELCPSQIYVLKS
jgi:hypothetical protein